MSSTRTSIFCPYCHRHTSLEPALADVYFGGERFRTEVRWERLNVDTWWIGVCNFCGNPVLVRDSGQTVYPHPLPEPTSEHIPTDIRADMDEAKQCLAVSAWRAAAVMARRAMQAAAIEKGAKNGRLGEQISELASIGKITVDVKEWADAVRWVGNDAAHPTGDPVNQTDAEEVLSLAEQFLNILYVSPALAKSLRERKGK